MKAIGRKKVIKIKPSTVLEFVRDYHDQILQLAAIFEYREEESLELAVSACEQLYLNLSTEKEEASFPIEDWLKVTFTASIVQVKRIRSAETHHHGILLEFEEYFHTLPHTNQQILLLHHVWNYPISTLTKILHQEQLTVSDILLSAKKELNLLLLEQKDLSETCLSMETLLDYAENKQDNAGVEDHLEFCPTCRYRIESWKKTASFLDTYFHPATPFDGADELEALVKVRFKPYEKKKKKKALLKQALGFTAMIAAFLTFMTFLPELTHVKTLASNYVKHGSFYNVWDEGTYVADDAGIKIEMTGIELTALSAGLHFTIQSSEKDLVLDYTETGKQLLSKPELIFVKIGEEVLHLPHSIIATNEAKTEGTIYFNVDRLEVEEIQDEFILQFQTSRIGGVFGSWNIEIPIDYAKGSKEQTKYTHDEPFVMGDIVEVDVESFSSTETSSLFEMKVDFTNEEKDRIEQRMEELRQVTGHPIEYPHLYTDYRVVNGDGEEVLQAGVLLPFSFNEELDMDASAMHSRNAYHPYIVDEDSREIVRPLREGEKLFLELREISYTEPVSLEIPIIMKEVEKAPVGLEYRGTSLDFLTVKILEADGDNPERYSIVLTGTHAKDAFIKRFHWSLRDQGDQYLEYYTNWHNYYEAENWMEDNNTLMKLEIPTNQQIPDTIWIDSFYVTNHLVIDGLERIPLN
ncbi:anti-sigma factor [Sutcliffiella deserti]|uniref:hypothetical protein n=1 Tax=Sutcliffiella deserti TaxID=2875501 RepID=UPI001CBD4632|nr:hypothetical protein [Sutcliffiella deserti]